MQALFGLGHIVNLNVQCLGLSAGQLVLLKEHIAQLVIFLLHSVLALFQPYQLGRQLLALLALGPLGGTQVAGSLFAIRSGSDLLLYRLFRSGCTLPQFPSLCLQLLRLGGKAGLGGADLVNLSPGGSHPIRCAVLPGQQILNAHFGSGTVLGQSDQIQVQLLCLTAGLFSLCGNGGCLAACLLQGGAGVCNGTFKRGGLGVGSVQVLLQCLHTIGCIVLLLLQRLLLALGCRQFLAN